MTEERRTPEDARGVKRKAAESTSSPSRKRPGERPIEKPHFKRREGESSRSNTGSRDAPPANRPAPRSPPRKRPGARAAISKSQQDAARRRAEEREAQLQEDARKTREGVQDAVTQHYNLVPERGRDWRKTESRIKGLRSYNNWVKSCIIQKFARSESKDAPPYTPIKVLDIGCGKGGDLQKWQSAPQRVELYVGVDPADVSIAQARERYVSMQRSNQDRGRNDRRRKNLFHGEFVVRDCFSKPIEEIPIIRQVGFDAGVGPGQVQRWGGGGFDVVSMMFCLHYSFESQEKARTMIRNVAGSLKKGGRFLGVIPNSAVLTEKVKDYHRKKAELNGGKPEVEEDEDNWDPEQPLDASKPESDANAFRPNDEEEDDWDPEKSLDNQPKEPAIESTIQPPWDDNDDDWDPEKSLDTQKPKSEAEPKPEPEVKKKKKQEGFEWGNSIYRVKFPGATPPDGAFRPPYGWKYFYFLEEAVEEVPEYVVPWEAFRALAEDYNLELQYYKPFAEVWEEEKDDRYLGPLSERMNVRGRDGGTLLIRAEEMEAASFYTAFCFYKV